MSVDDRASIMVIGGDADFAYLMRRYVGKAAYRTVVASPGPDPAALAARVQPVAIILEADGPGPGCWQVLRELKSRADTGHIPVVLCSWQDPEESRRGGWAGEYLRKPILYEDFVAALARLGVLRRS